jgi:hypothetical protein
MSRYTGRQTVISVGDKGVFRLATYEDLTYATTVKILIFAKATYDADTVDPTPLAALDAEVSSLSPVSPAWKIQAENPGTIFTAEGFYVLRSYAEWGSEGRSVLGAPVEVFVTRGSGTIPTP